MTDDSMKNIIYDVNAIRVLEEIIGTNKELIGFLRQKQQHEAAKKESRIILKDIASGKIKELFIPTTGNIVIPKKADKETKKMMQNRIRTMENVLNGIDGQITHRNDSMNELSLKAYRAIFNHLKTNNIKIPDLEACRPKDELPSVYKKEEKK